MNIRKLPGNPFTSAGAAAPLLAALLFGPAAALAQGAGPTGWWTDANGVNHYGSAPSAGGGLDPSAMIQGQLMGMAINGLINAAASSGNSAPQANEAQRQQLEEQARQNAARQERELAMRREQERLQRLREATEMRNFWDNSAGEMDNRLDDVFSIPGSKAAPFGIPGNPPAGQVQAALREDAFQPDAAPHNLPQLPAPENNADLQNNNTPGQVSQDKADQPPNNGGKPKAAAKANRKVLKSINPFDDFVFHDVPIRPDGNDIVVRHLDPNGVAAQADAKAGQLHPPAPPAGQEAAPPAGDAK